MHLLVQQLVVWSDQYCIDPKVITQHTAGYASRNTLCCSVSPIETPLSFFINILEIRLLFRKLHHLYRSHRCERFCTFSAPLKTKTSIFQTVGSAKETNTPSYQLWDISWGQCFCVPQPLTHYLLIKSVLNIELHHSQDSLCCCSYKQTAIKIVHSCSNSVFISQRTFTLTDQCTLYRWKT